MGDSMVGCELPIVNMYSLVGFGAGIIFTIAIIALLGYAFSKEEVRKYQPGRQG